MEENTKIVNSQIVNLTDTELDSLFQASAVRRQTVEQINRQVMRTVRRDMRRKTVRRWAQLLATCFLLPAAVVLYVFVLHRYMPNLSPELAIVCYALPLTAIVALLGKNIRNFTLEV